MTEIYMDQEEEKTREIPEVITVPEGSCPNKAISVARSLKELPVKNGYMGVQYKITDEKFYCLDHQKSGQIEKLDGTISVHPAMSAE